MPPGFKIACDAAFPARGNTFVMKPLGSRAKETASAAERVRSAALVSLRQVCLATTCCFAFGLYLALTLACSAQNGAWPLSRRSSAHMSTSL